MIMMVIFVNSIFYKTEIIAVYMFILMLYIPDNNFLSCQDDFLSLWVELVLGMR